MTDGGQAAVAVEVNHNAVRYIGGASYDPSTGEIDGGAFERKPKDTDGLSFTVRGILHANTLEDVAAIRKITASRMKLGKTGCFAELNVGAMLETLAEFGDFFSFVYDPLPQEGSKLANPAHALLLGLPFVDEAVGSLKSEYAGDLLRRQIVAIYPAYDQADGAPS